MADQAPIVVYGATGFTGTLVAHELRRRGLDFVLSGRSAGKLAALASELGGDVATRAVALDDLDGLRHLLGDARVVINCAGPFVRYGEPVVRAAVETGTHYVDTTGEQPWMKHVQDRFDAPARAAEVALVPAMGFDYVPGDLLAHLVAQGIEPLENLVLAYSTQGVQPTRGTLRTALGMLADNGSVYEGGEWRPAPLIPNRGRFQFPAPLGSQPVMRYPSGEVLTVPRHVDTRRVTSLITVATFAGNAAAAPLVPVLVPAMTLALRSPLGGMLEPLLARYPEGPSDASRSRVAWTIAAIACGLDGRTRHAVVRGGDVYGLTAVTAVHGAALMCEEGYDRAGALAPAEAYDAAAFLDALAEHGVSVELND